MKFVKKIYETFVADPPAPDSYKCLRHKTMVDPLLTDQQIFKAMELGDCWEDAAMPSLYNYLRQGQHLVIPDSWLETINAFDKELNECVFGWKYYMVLWVCG